MFIFVRLKREMANYETSNNNEITQTHNATQTKNKLRFIQVLAQQPLLLQYNRIPSLLNVVLINSPITILEKAILN